jgi:outer membrane usher protein
MTLRSWAVVSLMFLALAARPAVAEDAPLVLELVLNGHPTGKVGVFLNRDGALSATASELSDLGFLVPSGLDKGDVPILLEALPGVRAELDAVGQRVRVTAGDTVLKPTLLGPEDARSLVPVSPSRFGAVLNYDLLGTAVGGGRPTGGASLDGRLFGPYGFLTATGLASLGGSSVAPLRRLDTTYEYDEPDEGRVWRGGDLVSSALSWTRPVRLLGGQFASDFTLRPDLVTTAVPVLTSSASVPSTVDVLIDGVRQYSQQVQPGPFQIRSLPTVSGAGEVGVAVQDELGRQTIVTLPFYASPQLLAPGLASYSVELGAVRQSYGGPSDGYRNGAAIASLRYGLSDWLTPEAHGEFGGRLQQAGAGGTVRVGSLGVVSLAGAGSAATTGVVAAKPVRVSGWTGVASAARQAGGFSFTVSAAAATAGYRDTAALNGSPYPRLLFSASAGRSFGRWGGVSLGYVSQRGGLRDFGAGSVSASRTSIVTSGYSVRLGDRWGLYANGFRDMGNGNFSVLFGVTFTPFDRVSTSAGATMDRTGRPSGTFQATRPATEPGDWGLSVADQEGQSTSRRATAEYLSTLGRASAGVAQSGNAGVGQAELRGGVVFTDGTVLLSDTVTDSFAVVRTGEVADVPVTFENRPVGTTGSGGRLLVPYLNGFQANTLGVDANRVPPDVQLDSTSQAVRPGRRAGGRGGGFRCQADRWRAGAAGAVGGQARAAGCLRSAARRGAGAGGVRRGGVRHRSGGDEPAGGDAARWRALRGGVRLQGGSRRHSGDRAGGVRGAAVRGVALVAWLVMAGPAAAQFSHASVTCALSATPLNFGGYSPAAASPADFSATITVTCTTSVAGPVPVSGTLTLSPGGGGSAGSRRLASDGAVLRYQVYADGGYSAVWGDGTGGSMAVPVSGTVGRGQPLRLAFTARGRLLARQGGAAAGVYSDMLAVSLTY